MARFPKRFVKKRRPLRRKYGSKAAVSHDYAADVSFIVPENTIKLFRIEPTDKTLPRYFIWKMFMSLVCKIRPGKLLHWAMIKSTWNILDPSTVLDAPGLFIKPVNSHLVKLVCSGEVLAPVGTGASEIECLIRKTTVLRRNVTEVDFLYLAFYCTSGVSINYQNRITYHV
ncbi:coat protein [Cardamom bushy dwarf virus]|uniref:Capsid protein n=1 Tax=Cardamom bushy dwarf virus TaxID=262588 RepID=W0G0M4_9VIRU|nr:coat protein [Cardamom bushy dwarf virus]AHF47847.1 coat protein [Cardamom bushy dwarf virus]AHF47848.1 coat protein [Cardamom bushy dwarf virus]AHF47853.1 coat protein [Cardamom bushy dwarf virus]AHF47854.1 coat protein [Cardamom bushy dwarf virus]